MGVGYERSRHQKSLVARSLLKVFKINLLYFKLLPMLADRIASLSRNYPFIQQNFIEHILCNKLEGR